jgi:hypothetical protein
MPGRGDSHDAAILLHRAGWSHVGIENEGLELRNSDAAWVEATIACGELLRDLKGRLKPGDHWSMEVKDNSGAVLYLLEFKTSSR